MSIRVDRPAVVCPYRCTVTEHDDTNRPGDAGPDYDTATQGRFIHWSTWVAGPTRPATFH